MDESMMTVPKYHRPNTIAWAVEIKVRHGSARSEIGPSLLCRVGEAPSAAAKEDLIEHPEFQRLSRHVMANMRQENSASIVENLI